MNSKADGKAVTLRMADSLGLQLHVNTDKVTARTLHAPAVFPLRFAITEEIQRI